MKKILCFAAVLCILGNLALMADDAPDAAAADTRRPQATRSKEQLVSENISDLKARISELERRVNDIDRDRRFSDDRLRQLDRDVSELKRRF